MVLERSLGVLGRLTTLSILGDLVGSWWTVELHISMLEQFRYLAECVRRQDGEVLLYENTAAEMIPRLIYRNLGSFPFRGFDCVLPRNQVLEGGAEICERWGVK